LVTNTEIINTKPAPPKSGVAGYFVTMAVAIVLLYVLNNISTNQIQPIDPTLTTYYPNWVVNISNELAAMHIPYLTRFFISCLWAINLFLGFTLIGNFTLLLYRPRWFHHLVMLVICALAILAVYVFYEVFPLEIESDSLTTLVRVTLWVIMAAIAVALILRLFPLIKALKERKPPQPTPDLAITPLSPDLPVDSTPAPPSETPQLPPDSPVSAISPETKADAIQPQPSEPPQPPETPASPPQN
jgi:hypothetical protein